MILNYEDKQVKRIHYLKKNILLTLFLFAALIAVSLIIFCNYFYFMDQKNIDKKEVNKHNSNNQKLVDPSEFEKQTIANVKRLLPNTQINTWTANNQQSPKVTSLSNGNFVVVWQSYEENSSGFNSIYGQIFYSNGEKMGNEFPISNYITSDQYSPNVAASFSRFMVV